MISDGVLCLLEEHRQPLSVLLVVLRSQLSFRMGSSVLQPGLNALSLSVCILEKTVINDINFHNTPQGWPVVYIFRLPCFFFLFFFICV